MKTRVNTNVFTLPVPRVLYTIDNMIFFQQVGVMYLTQGDVEVDDVYRVVSFLISRCNAS